MRDSGNVDAVDVICAMEPALDSLVMDDVEEIEDNVEVSH